MKIGVQIKLQRERHQWSQQELADKLHISPQSISKWEQDTALPSFANVVALSDLFELSIDDLVRTDNDLMNHLTSPSRFSSSEKVLWGSILLAAVSFVAFLILRVNFSVITPWLQSASEICLIWLLFTVDWRKINQAITRRSVILAIIVLTLYLIPSFNDFLQGFLTGVSSTR